LGRLLGHQCLSLNAIVANRIEKKFSTNGTALIEKLIVHALPVISAL
jgi:uridine phosphorylase